MPRKLKTTTFRKTQHKKKPRKSYKKSNAKTYRRKKVVGGVNEGKSTKEPAKKASKISCPKQTPLSGIKRSKTSFNLQGDCEKAQDKACDELPGLLAKLNNDTK